MQAGVSGGRNREKFTDDNVWESRTEIPEIFKNYDIVEMQAAVAGAMPEAAKRYGSRGSAFVLRDGAFSDREPIGENEKGREELLLIGKRNGEIYFDLTPVKPIPQRELWFEKVWNEYNELTKSTGE